MMEHSTCILKERKSINAHVHVYQLYLCGVWNRMVL